MRGLTYITLLLIELVSAKIVLEHVTDNKTMELEAFSALPEPWLLEKPYVASDTIQIIDIFEVFIKRYG